MYKLILFLKKTDQENIQTHFIEYTVKYLADVVNKEVKIAKVESNLLMDIKYSLFCEIEVESKDIWDSLMNTSVGKKLNKDLMDFHHNISAVFVDYNFNK